MRALARQITSDESVSDGKLAIEGEELATLALALDEWLTRGGFLPDAWASQRDTQPTPEEG
jgi:hypothetical protein